MTEAAVEPLSVTIKYGKGYEETWANFRGTTGQIRQSLIHYFGISEDYATGVSLHELVVAATSVAHGTGNVAAVLGAVPISANEPAATPGTAPTGEAAWEGVDKSAPPYGGGTGPDPEPVNPNNNLIIQLKEAASIEDLKKLWAANQEAFSDDAVSAAYKTKGKALKAAAS